MKTFILKRLLIITSIMLFQGCDSVSECNKQFCRNGVIVLDACTRDRKTIIITDDNDEAIRCKTKKLN